MLIYLDKGVTLTKQQWKAFLDSFQLQVSRARDDGTVSLDFGRFFEPNRQ